MRLIRINYCVIPDLISLPRQLVSRGHPEYPALLSWIPLRLPVVKIGLYNRSLRVVSLLKIPSLSRWSNHLLFAIWYLEFFIVKDPTNVK